MKIHARLRSPTFRSVYTVGIGKKEISGIVNFFTGFSTIIFEAFDLSG